MCMCTYVCTRVRTLPPGRFPVGKLMAVRKLFPFSDRCLEQYPRLWDSLVQPVTRLNQIELNSTKMACVICNFIQI